MNTRATSQPADNNQADSNYFDLHVMGLGYLNRIREVNSGRGRKAGSFWACSVSALRGSKDEVEYTRLDLKIAGEEALAIIKALKDASEKEGNKIIVGFKAGDIYTDTFQYKEGKRKDEWDSVIKGRLLQIKWVKLNGRDVSIDELLGRNPAGEQPGAQNDDESFDGNSGQAPQAEATPMKQAA